MSLSQNSFPFNDLPVELHEHIIQFTTNDDVNKLMSVNKKIYTHVKSLATDAAEKFRSKEPVSNPFLQYVGFVEYMADCKRKNENPIFNLEQFANLEHLHHPYNFYTYFVNDQRLRKLPNIRALHLASHNYCGANLFNLFEELSDVDKKFLENYEVNSSVTPINLLAGQYQLIQVIENDILTENEQFEKVKKLVNKGVIFSTSSLQKNYRFEHKVLEFLKNVEQKNDKILNKVKLNQFAQNDLNKLGQEGEAQVNIYKILQFFIYKHEIDFAKKLIEKGCNINFIQDFDGNTDFSFNLISTSKYYNKFKEYKFNINAADYSFQNILFKLNNTEELDFLIENGLDIEVKDLYNKKAYQYSLDPRSKNNLLTHKLKQAHIELAVKYFTEGNFKRAAENLNLVLKHSENKAEDSKTFTDLLNEKVNFNEMDARQKVSFNQKLTEFMKLIQTGKTIA